MGPGSVLLAVTTCVLWGGTAVSNQFVMDVLPPIYVAGLRFLLAGLFMYGWCLVIGAPLDLDRKGWSVALILGTLLFFQISLFNVGAFLSSTSHASILVNSYIFWVAIGEHLLHPHARRDLRHWGGLVLSGVGCLMVLLNTEAVTTASRDAPTLSGDLLLVFSGFILGGKILYTKHAVRKYPPETMIFWHDVIGTAMFLLCSALLESPGGNPMTLTAWIALLFSGLIISGFCFGANAILLKRHGASHVSVYSFATPIFGVALGVLLRGDELSASLFAGGLLVAGGIFLVNTSGPANAED
jgi:drug/metabolite transporter (DMT)-like permease